MRKILTHILPLYFAGIIMLAFIVLPHHHHDSFICFTVSHCEETPEAGHHDHDPLAAHEGCVQQLLQSEITRSLSLGDNCTDGHCHHFIHSLFLATAIFEILSTQAENDPFPDFSYRASLHPVLLSQDLSGRAPPFHI